MTLASLYNERKSPVFAIVCRVSQFVALTLIAHFGDASYVQVVVVVALESTECTAVVANIIIIRINGSSNNKNNIIFVVRCHSPPSAGV